MLEDESSEGWPPAVWIAIIKRVAVERIVPRPRQKGISTDKADLHQFIKEAIIHEETDCNRPDGPDAADLYCAGRNACRGYNEI